MLGLRYLFEVEYTDGERFKQAKEDISTIDPKRPAMFDVKSSGKEIRLFTLKRFLEHWSIDLETGIFTHNGSEFQLERNILPVKRELVYELQTQVDASVTYNIKSGQIIRTQPGAQRRKFFFGYRVGEKEYLVGIK